MNRFLVMISLLLFLFMGRNAWAQIRPVPLPPVGPVIPVAPPIRPIEPLRPTEPLRPIEPLRPPEPERPNEPVAPTMVSVPKVSGYNRVYAERVLREAGLNLGEVKEVQSDQPRGLVLGQEPKSGNRVELHSAVNLTVAIPATTTFPVGWVTLGLTLVGLGGYYLYRVLSVPSPPPPPQVEIMIHQRAGEQTVSCKSPRRTDWEVSLRPIPDRGTQDAEVEGSLILKEKRA